MIRLFILVILFSFPAMAQKTTMEVSVTVQNDVIIIEEDGCTNLDGQECQSVEISNPDEYDVVIAF